MVEMKVALSGKYGVSNFPYFYVLNIKTKSNTFKYEYYRLADCIGTIEYLMERYVIESIDLHKVEKVRK